LRNGGEGDERRGDNEECDEEAVSNS
jgi:hypothetical protein